MINWVDILLFGIIIKFAFSGQKSDTFTESFKLFGIFLATFLSLHYYTRLGDFLNTYFIIPKEFGEVSAYLIIIGSIIASFLIIRQGWNLISDFKINDLLNQWGGFVLAVIRGYLICGLVYFGFLIPDHNFSTQFVKKSLSAPMFREVSSNIYQFWFTTFVMNGFPGENINEKALSIVSENEAGDVSLE